MTRGCGASFYKKKTKTKKSNSDKLKHRANQDSKERVQCYVEYKNKDLVLIANRTRTWY